MSGNPEDHGLDLSRPRTRWALARAGGWAGTTEEIIEWFDWECPQTGVRGKLPVYAFVDTRARAKGCEVGLTTCYRLGCPAAGACLGAP